MKSLPSKFVLAGCIAAALCTSWSVASGQNAAKDAAKQSSVNIAMTKTRLTLAGVSGDTLEKAMKIVEEHAPKIADVMAKKDATLTPVQRQVLTNALRASTQGIRDGSKKPADLTAETDAAFQSLNMPAAQKAKYDAAQQAHLAAMRAQNEALRPLLTPEQQTKMGIPPMKK